MTPRPPSDGVVALRSLPRRARALFVGLDEDESADALARRPAADGSTAVGHLAAAAKAVTQGASDLHHLLTSDQAVIAPIDVAALATQAAPGSLDDRISELSREAEELAARTEHLSADDWARRASFVGSTHPTTAADVFWQAVDAAVAELKAAERTLDEARRAR